MPSWNFLLDIIIGIVLMAAGWRFILATSMDYKPIKFRWYRVLPRLGRARGCGHGQRAYPGWRLQRSGETIDGGLGPG